MSIIEIKQLNSFSSSLAIGEEVAAQGVEQIILQTPSLSHSLQPISFSASQGEEPLFVEVLSEQQMKLESKALEKNLKRQFGASIDEMLLRWGGRGFPLSGFATELREIIEWFIKEEPYSIPSDCESATLKTEIEENIAKKMGVVRTVILEAMKRVRKIRPLAVPFSLREEIEGLRASAYKEKIRMNEDPFQSIENLDEKIERFEENSKDKSLSEQIRLLREFVDLELSKLEPYVSREEFKAAKERIDQVFEKLPTEEKLKERFDFASSVVLSTIEGMDESLRSSLSESLKNSIFVKIKDFYLNMLDAYPDLHPYFEGSSVKVEAIHACSDLLDFASEGNLSEKETQMLELCAEKLQKALSFFCLQSYQDDEQNALAMQQQIQDLPIGQSCVFLGLSKGHAIIYQIVRESEEVFSFTIVNTGHDEPSAHLRRPNWLSRWVYQTDSNEYEHKSYRVPSSGFTIEFLRQIIPANSMNIETPELVAHLDEYLVARQGAVRQPGRLHQFQSRQNCSIKCIMSWLKGELIRELGETEGRALFAKLKYFKAEKKYAELKETIAEAPEEILQDIYKKRIYDPSDDSEPVFVSPVPASKEELKSELGLLYEAAIETIGKWKRKAFPDQVEPNPFLYGMG